MALQVAAIPLAGKLNRMSLLIMLCAIAQAPAYDAFSDQNGDITTEAHGRGLMAMLQSPGQLETLYTDAGKGDARARRVFQILETDYFPDCGRKVAELVGYAERARQRGLENRLVLSAMNALLGVTIAATAVREAEAAASVPKIPEGATAGTLPLTSLARTLDGILANASPGRASKPGMGSMQYTKPGGVPAANRDFDVLAGGQPVKTYSDGISGNPIKIRYE